MKANKSERQLLSGQSNRFSASRLPLGKSFPAVLAIVLLWPGSGAFAADEPPIVVTNDRIQIVVEEGQLASTACSSFRVPVKSAMDGVGCRIRALEQRNMPFIQVELVNDQDGLSLKDAGTMLLQGVASNIASSRNSQNLIDNPGPYDSNNEGRFLGAEDTTVDGQPAIKYSWAVGKRTSGYKSIKVRTIVKLPAKRFFWDGHAQGFLLVVGNELGYKSNLYNPAIESLDIH